MAKSYVIFLKKYVLKSWVAINWVVFLLLLLLYLISFKVANIIFNCNSFMKQQQQDEKDGVKGVIEKKLNRIWPFFTLDCTHSDCGDDYEIK